MNGDRPKSGWLVSWRQWLRNRFCYSSVDKEAILAILRANQQRSFVGHEGLAMVEGVFGLGELQVRDVMVPRSRMEVIQHNTPLESLLTQVSIIGHSRVPVINEQRHEIIGVILVKDLLHYCQQVDSFHFDLREVLRVPLFVPESKRLNVLLREFRKTRNHLAIVIDEFGGIAGLITIEDILEQIVGDIEDEHDDEEEVFIAPHGPKSYLVKAITPIEEFNQHFQMDLSDEEVDTVGGFVLRTLGHMPYKGEQTLLNGWRVKVLRADQRRIYLLEVSVHSEQDNESGVSLSKDELDTSPS